MVLKNKLNELKGHFFIQLSVKPNRCLRRRRIERIERRRGKDVDRREEKEIVRRGWTHSVNELKHGPLKTTMGREKVIFIHLSSASNSLFFPGECVFPVSEIVIYLLSCYFYCSGDKDKKTSDKESEGSSEKKKGNGSITFYNYQRNRGLKDLTGEP